MPESMGGGSGRSRCQSVRGPVSSVVEVRDGAPVARTLARARGRAGGAQNLAPTEVVRACTWVGEVRGTGPRQGCGRATGAASLI